jgi:hypothetical protein
VHHEIEHAFRFAKQHCSPAPATAPSNAASCQNSRAGVVCRRTDTSRLSPLQADGRAPEEAWCSFIVFPFSFRLMIDPCAHYPVSCTSGTHGRKSRPPATYRGKVQ